mmetsp:Transcript_14844/g.33791  ORF Transcript_14844/g.33791 Transcript_14844/m.33791 type:complete len:201 (-) Transcript_14844:95-697(-)
MKSLLADVRLLQDFFDPLQVLGLRYGWRANLAQTFQRHHIASFHIHRNGGIVEIHLSDECGYPEVVGRAPVLHGLAHNKPYRATFCKLRSILIPVARCRMYRLREDLWNVEESWCLHLPVRGHRRGPILVERSHGWWIACSASLIPNTNETCILAVGSRNQRRPRIARGSTRSSVWPGDPRHRTSLLHVTAWTWWLRWQR